MINRLGIQKQISWTEIHLHTVISWKLQNLLKHETAALLRDSFQ